MLTLKFISPTAVFYERIEEIVETCYEPRLGPPLPLVFHHGKSPCVLRDPAPWEALLLAQKWHFLIHLGNKN